MENEKWDNFVIADEGDADAFRCQFPVGTTTLQKVDILTTAIKIIIQRDPAFLGGAE